MNHKIKIWVTTFFVALTLTKTFGFPLNNTLSKTYGELSTMGANQATDTFNDDRPTRSQSPDTDNTTTEANLQLDDVRYLYKDDATSLGASKIDAVNNAGK